MGCVTPIGNSVEEFREALYAGRSGISAFDTNFVGALAADPGLRFKTTAKVKGFDATRYFASGVMASMESNAQFGVVAARQAAKESGLTEHHDAAGIAIITGCACGGRAADEEANRNLYTRNARVQPMAIVRTMASSGASNIAIDLGISGPVLNLATACASGTHAIGLAFQMVRAGMAPAAIAGGYEAPLTFGFLRAWDSMRVVSPTACRPFAADRDGMTLGEGAAMLVLEPMDAAVGRGARIYAEVVGRAPHYAAQGGGRGAGDAQGARGCGGGGSGGCGGARGLHQRTWDGHADQRCGGGGGDSYGAGFPGGEDSGEWDEVADRALDWGDGCD
jgi:3-oxoacyl-[acyl-carrier-protein] synthase II/nodulation protein E